MITPPTADLYAVLGVAPSASAAELDHAYRRLVRRHHPDTREAPEAEASDERLQQVLAAYAVLRDPAARAGYDRDHHPELRRSRPPSASTSEPALRVGPVRWHRSSR
jgi:curved DNA-binding protein CbpA